MKVSAAKPAVGGGIWMGDMTAALPTNASAALSAAFKTLGYVSEDGVTRAISRDNTVVHAWGGDPVAVLSNNKTETFQFKLIEADNLDVLGLTFGEASGALATGITVKSKADISAPHRFVISTILADNIHQRICIPEGVVSEIGEMVYRDNEVIGFDVTITAMADSAGITAYEYMQTIDPVAPPAIELNRHSVSIAVGETFALDANVIPVGQTVTWGSSDSEKASVSGGTVTGAAAGNCIITASITVDGVTYNDTCTVIVTGSGT